MLSHEDGRGKTRDESSEETYHLGFVMKLGGKIKEAISKRKWKIRIKNWMLFLILVPLLMVDATLLRHDHIRMAELRDAVLNADAELGVAESEEQAEVSEANLAQALIDLKEFVFRNVVINIVDDNGIQRITFGTGPFYLEHQYIRAANKALREAEARLSGDGNPNGNIYGQAGEVCRAAAINNGWTWDSAEFINCMLSEIAKYPSAEEIHDTVIAALPSTELYRRNYASPVWAPTLTGFLLLITLIIVVVIIVRIIIWIVLRLALIFV